MAVYQHQMVRLEGMMVSKKTAFFFLLFFLIAFGSRQAFTQPPDQEPAAPQAEAPRTSSIDTLTGIISSMESLREQLRTVEKELKAVKMEDEKHEYQEKIKGIQRRLDELQKDFESIATGVDLAAFTSIPQVDFDWKQEIQELLGPIVQELKAMTARPREIERLRNEVLYCQQRVAAAREASRNIQELIAQDKEHKLKSQLSSLEKEWKSQEQQLSNQLAIFQHQLTEKLNEQTSLLDSMQNILRMFFRSRGRNFVFALITFVAVFALLRFLRRHAIKVLPSLVAHRRSFFARLADVLYQLMCFACAGAALLFVLYALGDWALLALAILFFFGIIWTAKQSIPKFWEEYKLLLNLGSVKEGERIIYNGLPWKVNSINYYSQLINPALTGAAISLPLNKLVGMYSRPYDPDEPWFPCKEHDWVILDDGVHGKIVLQSPEMVQLVLLGGSRKTYPTEDFLKQNPKNISTNFRLGVTFGVDYQHQSIITDEVPAKMKGMLTEKLEKEGFGKDVVDLKVEFKEAGASSLDLAIIVDFSGRLAKSHEMLRRLIQRIAVQACNEYGWVIPFPQMTIHTAYPDLPDLHGMLSDDHASGVGVAFNRG
jgi:predicted  nucleic acid-binding Zn-ribbon protein